MNKSIPASYSKRNPQTKQRNPRPPRRPRPHGHPRPDRYRPPSRPARFMLDVGRNISLTLTLQQHNIRPNAATLAKCGGDHE